jgi:hypothetical protein
MAYSTQVVMWQGNVRRIAFVAFVSAAVYHATAACFLARLLVGAATLAAAPALPGAFWRLPADVRARATVVVSGTYTTGSGPCEWLPNGRRRWPLLMGFSTRTVYRGVVKANYVGVQNRLHATSPERDLPLVEKREYLLLLRPSDSSRAVIERPDGRMDYRDALPTEEIVAIVEP